MNGEGKVMMRFMGAILGLSCLAQKLVAKSSSFSPCSCLVIDALSVYIDRKSVV